MAANGVSQVDSIFYEIIEEYRVNILFTVPTALQMLKGMGDRALAPFDLSGTISGDVTGLEGPATVTQI